MSSLSTSYNSCGADSLPPHICDVCPDFEYARVRGVCLINRDYLDTLLADPTDLTLWQDGIDSGDIIQIGETAGSYDPGTPAELKGYGDRPKTNGPRTHTLTYNDPNYATNYNFYNALTESTQWVPAWRTSTKTHIADVAATITPSDPHADDETAVVDWQVAVSWISKNLAAIYDAPLEVFTCAV